MQCTYSKDRKWPSFMVRDCALAGQTLLVGTLSERISGLSGFRRDPVRTNQWGTQAGRRLYFTIMETRLRLVASIC